MPEKTPLFSTAPSPHPGGRFWVQIGVVLISLLLLRCGGPQGEKSDTTAVQIKLVGAPEVQKASALRAPGDPIEITLDVTGPDLDPIHQSASGSPGDVVVFELDVENGADRRFAVRVMDAIQQIDLEGSETRTLDGEPQEIIIDLRRVSGPTPTPALP